MIFMANGSNVHRQWIASYNHCMCSDQPHPIGFWATFHLQDKYPPTNVLSSSDIHLCSGTKIVSGEKIQFSEGQLGWEA
jgi:hypothetical protein